MNPKIDAFARSQNHASAGVNVSVSVYVCVAGEDKGGTSLDRVKKCIIGGRFLHKTGKHPT